ncbi:MAG: DUF4976 domain-containing protein [Armatimonadetes bacterium]|nr:DUF4976 domain-containing protein [Armatimonadota bacterium]
MGKQNLYEAGMRVPFVIAGPGIRRGRSPALVYLHDLFPTLCDLAGEPVPTGLDGRSLVPVLRGRQEGVRETLFTAYRDVQRAVRDRRWKLIRYPRIHRTQLFDLRNDPDERRDLAGDPRYRERIEQLRAKLEEWQKDQGDPTPWSFEPRQDETFRPPR